MEERRKLERFELHVPAVAEVVEPSGQTGEIRLETRDISADGAFFVTDKPVSEGMALKLAMVISVDKLEQLIGSRNKIELKIEGMVIRSDSNGIAVIFDKKYKMRALQQNDESH